MKSILNIFGLLALEGTKGSLDGDYRLDEHIITAISGTGERETVTKQVRVLVNSRYAKLSPKDMLAAFDKDVAAGRFKK